MEPLLPEEGSLLPVEQVHAISWWIVFIAILLGWIFKLNKGILLISYI